jgi:peptidoglycan/xylan/chitin deacetylase (PgdA/CDA1 family)
MPDRDGAPLRLVGALAAAAAAVHVAPAITGLDIVRTRLFPGLAGTGSAQTVAVTFDDGPDPSSTPLFLKRLQDLGWRATFFMLGSMARKNPTLAAEVAVAGHDVALHGDVHRNLLFRGPVATASDLRRGFDALAESIGRAPRWFRPPYGILTGDALLTARRLGLRTVLWTAWGRDWRAEATPESIVTDIRKDLRPGGTVLLHDISASGSWRATSDALSGLDDLIRGLGVKPAPLSEHLAGPGSDQPHTTWLDARKSSVR